jgi:hypothetical protein
MKYMLMIADDPGRYEGEGGEALLADIIARHRAMHEEMKAAGVLWTGHQLQPAATATTVRTNGDVQTLHDGPYAETHEEFGGYYLIDVPDLDAAIFWARKIPQPGKGSVEVRPVVEREDA